MAELDFLRTRGISKPKEGGTMDDAIEEEEDRAVPDESVVDHGRLGGWTQSETRDDRGSEKSEEYPLFDLSRDLSRRKG